MPKKDQRKGLSPGAVLPFPGMAVTIKEEMGRGSNAVVYIGSYPDETSKNMSHTVIVKELFPVHAGIRRGDDGSIECSELGKVALDIHRKSFELGNSTHLWLQEKLPGFSSLNLNINTFHNINNTLYTVLGYSGGESLEKALTHTPVSLRQLTVRMLGVLDALEAFHQNGLLHLDIAPDNILLIGQGEREHILLIDFNTVRPMHGAQAEPVFEEIFKDASRYRSLKPGYGALEVESNDHDSISAPSDLFSVAAVFLRCLRGWALKDEEYILTPDYDHLECLAGQPETVKSCVTQILTKGLETLPEDRYQNLSEMRAAFRELLSRIDGVGVTCWALWEAGRRMVRSAIRQNPALNYLQEKGSLYPSRVEWAGQTAPLENFITWLNSADGRSTLLTAAGGMGKTTALMRAITSQSSHYRESEPVMIYLSLYGCMGDRPHQIRDLLLKQLRFDTASVEDAAHKLHELMSQPLESGAPALCLLLDGLNEVNGPIDVLVHEINALSHLKGVRLLVSSRSAESALDMDRAVLVPLLETDVEEALTRKHLLLPQSADMRLLLQTPMMLSIYIASSQVEQPFALSTQEELIDAYFKALLEKEMREMPDHQDRRFQIEAALKLVLPAIAGALDRAKAALDNEGLYPAVEKCCQQIGTPHFTLAFPEWIGHSSAIGASAQSEEEWYGIMVHDLLWKRLGLLIRDEQQRYHISHQILLEHLLEMEKNNRQLIAQKKWSQKSAADVLQMSERLFKRILESMAMAENQNNHLQSLLDYGFDCANRDEFDQHLKHFLYERSCLKRADRTEEDLELLMEMAVSGIEKVPWSKKPLDVNACRELLTFVSERWKVYDPLVEEVIRIMHHETAHERCAWSSPTYASLYYRKFIKLIDIDHEIANTLYQAACVPHLMGKFSPKQLSETMITWREQDLLDLGLEVEKPYHFYWTAKHNIEKMESLIRKENGIQAFHRTLLRKRAEQETILKELPSQDPEFAPLSPEQAQQIKDLMKVSPAVKAQREQEEPFQFMKDFWDS